MKLFLLSVVLSFVTFVNVQAQRVDREVADFIGSWRNIDRGDSRIRRIDIRADYDGRLSIEVWGDCAGEECSFGRSTGRLFVNPGSEARDEDRAAILFKFSRDRLSGNVLIRLNPRRDIVTHALIQLDNGSDVYRVERFQRDDGADADQDDREDTNQPRRY